MKLLHKLCPVTVICSYIYNMSGIIYSVSDPSPAHAFHIVFFAVAQCSESSFLPGSIVENRADLYDGEEPCPTQIYRERY